MTPELGAAIARWIDPANCTQKQGTDARSCVDFWPQRPQHWCRSCLMAAALEELRACEQQAQEIEWLGVQAQSYAAEKASMLADIQDLSNRVGEYKALARDLEAILYALRMGRGPVEACAGIDWSQIPSLHERVLALCPDVRALREAR